MHRCLTSAVVLGIAAVTLAACSSSGPSVGFRHSSKEYFSQRTYGAASPRVVSAGPMPRGGGHAVVGVAYNVAGKTYVPTDSPRFSETGLASWYGDAFHGRLTANGEVYDVNGLTAAHPTLPLPSYARVTDLENGRSIIVRVNDRGPFASDRIIDVSERVANLLGFEDDGTARVQVDYVGPARMDGQDDRMLLASYKGPSNNGGDNSMFAWLHPKPPVNQPPVVLASATAPLPRVRPIESYPPKPADAAPMVIDPDSSDDGDDPLAPLILRASMVTSYASQAPVSAAVSAASDLANGRTLQADLQAAARRAAARMDDSAQIAASAPPTGAGVTIQLGAFGDPGNASRIAAVFRRFGTVDSEPSAGGTRPLTVVRVALAGNVQPQDVLAAATDAGLTGAFVIAN